VGGTWLGGVLELRLTRKAVQGEGSHYWSLAKQCPDRVCGALFVKGADAKAPGKGSPVGRG
jgi:hypothetical protein